MATVLEPGADMDLSAVPSMPSPSLTPRFLDGKSYLLVVIGEMVTEEHLRAAIANIHRGETYRGDTGRGTKAPGGHSLLRSASLARGCPLLYCVCQLIAASPYSILHACILYREPGDGAGTRHAC